MTVWVALLPIDSFETEFNVSFKLKADVSFEIINGLSEPKAAIDTDTKIARA